MTEVTLKSDALMSLNLFLGGQPEKLGTELEIYQGEIEVNPYVQESTVASLADGGFIVIALNGYAQRYDRQGNPNGTSFQVDLGFNYDLAVTSLGDGGFVVVGTDWGQRYDANNNPLGDPFALWSGNLVEITDLADGSFIVVQTLGGDVAAQRYDVNGNPLGDLWILNHNDHDHLGISSLSIAPLANGGFVVTWSQDFGFFEQPNIYGQIYDADGDPIGDNFTDPLPFFQPDDPSFSNLEDNFASVAGLADGGFVLVWSAFNNTTTDFSVFAQIYDANGNFVNQAIQVNTTDQWDWKPSVTALNDGGFVVTWESGIYGEASEIYGQRFDGNGDPVGTEFVVNTSTEGIQGNTSVVTLTNGNIVTVWDSASQGIHGQIFTLNNPNSVNHAPVLLSAISQQIAVTNQPFVFNIPANTFTDPDLEDNLTFSSILDNGDSLPEWLTFDAETQTFSGIPDQQNLGNLLVKVTATDNLGASVESTFNLNVLNLVSPSPQIIGEVGRVTNITHERKTITFNHTYQNPVVLIESLSYNGPYPAIVRLIEVNNNSFTAMIQEPKNLDGLHRPEDFSYMVLEAGTWQLSNGPLIEVGTVNTNAITQKTWQDIDLKINFSETPVTFSQVQTYNEADFVRTRQRNHSSTGFEIALEEEEKKAYRKEGHLSETVGYFAMTKGLGVWDDNVYQVGNTADQVTHKWYNLNFGESFAQTPNFIGTIATYDDSDSAGLRYRNLGSQGVQVMIQEDTTQDREIEHTSEVVNFFAFAKDSLLSAYAYEPVNGVNHLTGTVQDDLIYGTPNKDLRFGGLGNDIFVLGLNQGLDTIADFTLNQDKILLTDNLNLGNLSFTDLGEGVLISHENNSLMLINGISLDSLTANHFVV